MSLYADFIKEYDGFDIIEIPDVGFATYKCAGEECYIKDVYIKPEHRSKRVSYDMQVEITKIAKEKGCTYLLGTVSPISKTATFSMGALIKDGFQFVKVDQHLMYFTKRVL